MRGVNSGKISAGCVDNEIVHIADLLPTFSSIAGYDVPLVNFDPSIKLDSAGLDEEFGMGDMVPQILHKPYSDSKKTFLWGRERDLPVSFDFIGKTTAKKARGVFAPRLAFLVSETWPLLIVFYFV